MNRTLKPLALVLLATGCPFEGALSGWEAQEQYDQGTVCVDAPTDGGEATITVNSGLCLSSSCSQNVESSCEATLDGDTITVTSSFLWETATGDVACTDDCMMPSATCTLESLPAGSYTVVHGDDSEAFDAPASDECNPWE